MPTNRTSCSEIHDVGAFSIPTDPEAQTSPWRRSPASGVRRWAARRSPGTSRRRSARRCSPSCRVTASPTWCCRRSAAGSASAWRTFRRQKRRAERARQCRAGERETRPHVCPPPRRTAKTVHGAPVFRYGSGSSDVLHALMATGRADPTARRPQQGRAADRQCAALADARRTRACAW